MAQDTNVGGGHVMGCIGAQQVFYAQRFDTNGASAPDGVTPVIAGVTIARASQCVFTVTINPAPATMVFGDATVIGDKPGVEAQLISYSTGVLTINLNDEDNTSGIAALGASDLDNVTIGVWAIFTRQS
jgi:hypothetical protein